MTYYPPLKEDLLPKVQVVYLSDQQNYFAFISTKERGKFLIYDLQKKIIAHKLELTDRDESHKWDDNLTYPSMFAIYRVDPDSRVVDRTYKKLPKIIAAF